MATLQLDGLRKSFGDTAVLQGIDLVLPDGEMLVIVGASGCGKSTLLRLVAGLETATAGRILLDGRDITRLDPSSRDIAMVFQNYALYPHMTVAENMAYSLRIRGLSKQAIGERVQQTAELLGLGALLARRPRELSGGQRQRVAMGRAIVREPKLFLFDEPLSNLDASLRVQMRAEIRQLQRRLGVTSLYVTHDQVEAMTLGDRLLVLHQGVPVQFAPPMEIFARPATAYVAGVHRCAGDELPGRDDGCKRGRGTARVGPPGEAAAGGADGWRGHAGDSARGDRPGARRAADGGRLGGAVGVRDAGAWPSRRWDEAAGEAGRGAAGGGVAVGRVSGGRPAFVRRHNGTAVGIVRSSLGIASAWAVHTRGSTGSPWIASFRLQ